VPRARSDGIRQNSGPGPLQWVTGCQLNTLLPEFSPSVDRKFDPPRRGDGSLTMWSPFSVLTGVYTGHATFILNRLQTYPRESPAKARRRGPPVERPMTAAKYRAFGAKCGANGGRSFRTVRSSVHDTAPGKADVLRKCRFAAWSSAVRCCSPLHCPRAQWNGFGTDTCQSPGAASARLDGFRITRK